MILMFKLEFCTLQRMMLTPQKLTNQIPAFRKKVHGNKVQRYLELGLGAVNQKFSINLGRQIWTKYDLDGSAGVV